MIKCSSEHSGT